MRLYYRRGPLIGGSQERVARAIRLRRMTGDVGDEVGWLAELASKGLNLSLDRRLRSRLAILPC